MEDQLWKVSRSPHPQNGISVSTLLFSTPLHLACAGTEKSSLSLHLSLSTSVSTVPPPPLSPRLSVSGDLRRAVKSTHVSLAGSSIRAELRVTFTHLLRSDICCAESHPLHFQ